MQHDWKESKYGNMPYCSACDSWELETFGDCPGEPVPKWLKELASRWEIQLQDDLWIFSSSESLPRYTVWSSNLDDSELAELLFTFDMDMPMSLAKQIIGEQYPWYIAEHLTRMGDRVFRVSWRQDI